MNSNQNCKAPEDPGFQTFFGEEIRDKTKKLPDYSRHFFQKARANRLLLTALIFMAVGIGLCAAQSVLQNGGNQAGTLLANTTNSYTLSASTGDNIVLRLGTVGFYGILRLYSSGGTLLTTAASGYDAELDFTATNTGNLTVNVAAYSPGGSGTYVLRLAQFPEVFAVPTGDEGGPMTNGGDYAGTNSLGDLDMWSFNANSGDNIVLRLGSAGYYGNLRLYGPDGALLKTAASGYDAELDFTATNSGTFTALVSAYSSDGIGTYVLHLAQFPEAFIVPDGDEGGLMANGGNYSGTNSLGDLDLWSFSANSGDNIVLRLGAVGYYGNLRLYGPDGALLKTVASGYDAELDFAATNSGTFTALVSAYSSSGVGTYVLHLAQFPEAFIVPDGDEGGPMVNGGDYSGTNSLGDLDLWSFSANSGDNIVLRMGAVGYYGNLRLYGPNGALLKTAASGYDAELDFTATNSGTFSALVSAYSSDGIGTYMLRLAQFPEAFIVPAGTAGGPMTNGTTYAGTNSLGDLTLWNFTACTGDSISLQLSPTNFTANLALYGSNGSLLKTATSAASAVINYTATNCGTFTVLLSSYSSGGTGTYGLVAGDLSYALKLCAPVVTAANISLNGVGGIPSAGYTLYSATNIATPFAQWTPIQTNQFDRFGVSTFTNAYNSTVQKMFFRLTSP